MRSAVQKDGVFVTKLTLDLPPMPKARPRVTGKGTFMPTKYQHWMTCAIIKLRIQWQDKPLNCVNHIRIEFNGGTARSDIDNDVGSVFDALVKSGVLKNDNKTVVSDFAATWKRATKNSINIYLFYPLENNKR